MNLVLFFYNRVNFKSPKLKKFCNRLYAYLLQKCGTFGLNPDGPQVFGHNLSLVTVNSGTIPIFFTAVRIVLKLIHWIAVMCRGFTKNIPLLG